LRGKRPFDVTWTPLRPGVVSFSGSGMTLNSNATAGSIRTRGDSGLFEPIPLVQTSTGGFEIDIWYFNLKYGWAQSEVFPGGLSATMLSQHVLPKFQNAVQLAMDLLSASHPIIEQEISLALKCVVPLAAPNIDVNISVSAPEFFGGIMFSLDPAPMLMEVLIHEYRHNILHVLNEEVPFFEDGTATKPTLLYSPWRADPRPAIGLLHALFTCSEVVRGYQLLLQSGKLSPKNRRAAARRRIGHTLRLQLGLDEFATVERLTPFGQGLFEGIS
jgi:HEXXH motif-containing protein